jgi:D-glycero-D-manno-heptose 1,7-bisphosphate phosphatase
MNKALFLDRDGVINVNHGHVHKIEDFDFIDGIFDLCRLAKQNGYLIIIVTNQAGIGKGYYTEEQFKKLNYWMIDIFRQNNIGIDGVYYCPHKPEENCFCRKPRPGMIFQASKELKIDLRRSILIGDKQSDIEAANLAGIVNTYLFSEQNHMQSITYLNKSIRANN